VAYLLSEPVTLYLVGRREGGKRLDQYLHERIPGLSRTRIQQMIRERVTLSWNVKARPSSPIRAGGSIHIAYTPVDETPLEIDIPVVASGEGWLAVDKPSGIPVHPVNKVFENSLIRMLRKQVGRDGLRLAHRLDRETSGLLLIAEDGPSARHFSMAFMQGQVGKQYLAMVQGAPAEDGGRIDLPIGEASGSQIYTKRAAGVGQPAVTEWSVERRYADHSLLRLFPQTGRRHQLRVHLEAIGHPILGDLLYGRPESAYLELVRGEGDPRLRDGGPLRQLLHSAGLEFTDPAGREIVLTSRPPADFVVAGGD